MIASFFLLGTAYATGTTQLGCLTYDDLLHIRRGYTCVNEKVVSYTNQVLTHIEFQEGPFSPGERNHIVKPPSIGLLDAHPELRILEEKIDRLLDQKVPTYYELQYKCHLFPELSTENAERM